MTTHGMMMSPGSGSGGGDGSEGRPKRPSGIAHPTVSVPAAAPPEACNVQEPMPVVLAKGTFIKFGVLIFGSLLITISGVLAFYWKHHYETTTHMKDGTIHLTSGERGKLETKAEAKESRKKITRTIKAHVDIKLREVKVEQKAQIQKLGDDLKREQKAGLKRILNEVKQTRRDVLRAGRGID